MEIFGLEIQMDKYALIIIIIVTILAIAGLISVFYYYRKRVWYAFVGATLAILISIFIPLILDQLFWIQINAENDLLNKIILAFESGFMTLLLKRLFGFGFSAANKTLQEQR